MSCSQLPTVRIKKKCSVKRKPNQDIDITNHDRLSFGEMFQIKLSFHLSKKMLEVMIANICVCKPRRHHSTELSVSFEVEGLETKIGSCTRECQRSEPLQGSGGMLSQKILKSMCLEIPFPAFSERYFPLKGNRNLAIKH